MKKIFLTNPPPPTDGNSLFMPAEETLLVSQGWDHRHALEANQVWLLLQMRAAWNALGPFSAGDLHRFSLDMREAHNTPTLTTPQIQQGILRLLELGVVKEADP